MAKHAYVLDSTVKLLRIHTAKTLAVVNKDTSAGTFVVVLFVLSIDKRPGEVYTHGIL